MAIFGIEVDNVAEANDFFLETEQRLQGTDMVVNPFFGSLKMYVSKDSVLGVASLKPMYPNLTLYVAGFFAILGLFAYWNGWGLQFFFVCMSLASVLAGYFWSSHFMVSMMKVGLRKAGYKGKVETFVGSKLSERLFRWEG